MNGKIPKTAIPIRTRYSMLNGKWSSQKFQDEQINEKFGVVFSDDDICIFCYNINVGNIPSALKGGTLVKKPCREW
jgi:hypothetical protein